MELETSIYFIIKLRTDFILTATVAFMQSLWSHCAHSLSLSDRDAEKATLWNGERSKPPCFSGNVHEVKEGEKKGEKTSNEHFPYA